MSLSSDPDAPFDWSSFAPRKIAYVSDLHLEFHPWSLPSGFDADLLVIAGDIHTKSRARSFVESLGVPCVCVAGNHDHYGSNLGSSARKLSGSPSSRVVFLENRELRMKTLRVIGATLWTDHALRGDPSASISRCEASVRDPYAKGLSDHHKIRTAAFSRFLGRHAQSLHFKSRQFLREALSTPFEGATLILTHHAPHPRSLEALDAQDRDPDFDAAYASDLSELLALGAGGAWAHGHVHGRCAYQEQGCWVVCNPRGYPGQSTGFDPWASLIVEGRQIAPEGAARPKPSI